VTTEYYSVSWIAFFVGGIIAYHRTYEKTFRDQLESIKENYKHKIVEEKKKEYVEKYQLITIKLVAFSEPVQKQVNICLGIILLILLTQSILIITPNMLFYEQLNLSEQKAQNTKNFIYLIRDLFIMIYTVGCFFLFYRAWLNHNDLKRTAEAAASDSKEDANKYESSIQAQKISTEAFMQQLQQLLSVHLPENVLSPQQLKLSTAQDVFYKTDTHLWRFRIKDGSKIIARSCRNYPSKDNCVLALEKTLISLRQGSNIPPSKKLYYKDKHELWRFRVIDDGKTIAVSNRAYQSQKECAQTVNRIIELFRKYEV